ncbi:MAG: YicC family protein [bacterium]|nr:YicC family protein [bacterium]
MHSMTGFGQASKENERFRMTVTLRGVNHRYLDLSPRMRDELRPLEPSLREVLSRRLQRGRVEVSVEVASLGTRDVEVTIDEAVADAVKTMADALAGRGVISGELQLRDLLRLPEVVQLQIRDPEWTDEDRALLISVVEAALDQLLTARAAEGEKLFAVLEERLAGLQRIGVALSELKAGMAAELSSSLRRRISELLDRDRPDEDRLAQEVAYLVDRADVSEELDRLESHLEQFRSAMRQRGSIGKRLDFLAQEIFRELNTLGAKCRDSEMTRNMLDAKVLCEQVREQVQNVE